MDSDPSPRDRRHGACEACTLHIRARTATGDGWAWAELAQAGSDQLMNAVLYWSATDGLSSSATKRDPATMGLNQTMLATSWRRQWHCRTCDAVVYGPPHDHALHGTGRACGGADSTGKQRRGGLGRRHRNHGSPRNEKE
jgi:hypothetical protein